MVDDITLNTGSGGDTLAAQDEGGVKYQEIKLTASGTGTTEDLSKAEDSAHSTGEHGIAALAVRKDTAAQLAGTDGDYSMLINDASGRLWVNVGNTVTVGSHAVTNAGTFVTQVDGAALTALQLIDDAVGAEGAALSKGILLQGDDGTDRKNINVDATTGDVQVDVTNTVTVAAHAVTNAGTFAVQSTLQAGTAEIGKLAAGTAEIGNVKNAGTFAVQSTLQTGSNAIGKLAANSGVNIGDTVTIPATSGGLSFFKSIDLDETEEEVKGSAGQLYFIHAMNLSASVLYLKVYNNTEAGVTVGTTVPDWTFPLPTQGDTNGAGTIIPIPIGMDCTVGITVACTTGIADNDSGAPGANECIVNIGFK